MVDSIGTKPVTADLSVTRIAAATPVSAPRPSVQTTPADVAQAGGLAQSLAASAPVDIERVDRIKQAIADGAYPIVPGTIADNMIALRMQLMGEGKN